jgi:hypothetical protein
MQSRPTLKAARAAEDEDEQRHQRSGEHAADRHAGLLDREDEGAPPARRLANQDVRAGRRHRPIAEAEDERAQHHQDEGRRTAQGDAERAGEEAKLAEAHGAEAAQQRAARQRCDAGRDIGEPHERAGLAGGDADFGRRQGCHDRGCEHGHGDQRLDGQRRGEGKHWTGSGLETGQRLSQTAPWRSKPRGGRSSEQFLPRQRRLRIGGVADA